MHYGYETRIWIQTWSASCLKLLRSQSFQLSCARCMDGEAVISKHWQQNNQSWVAGTDSYVHGKIERGWV